MKYERFEELPVWRAAADLGGRVMALAEDGAFRGRGDLGDQLQRAALSVSNNIAEGFELGTTQQLLTFIYYAKGSAGEVRSMLRIMAGMRTFEKLKFEISNLTGLAENISRQLSGWANSLQNSDVKGVRYLTDAVREERARKERAGAFLREIERYRFRGGGDGDAGTGE